jgi:hypothetical protein
MPDSEENFVVIKDGKVYKSTLKQEVSETHRRSGS